MSKFGNLTTLFLISKAKNYSTQSKVKLTSVLYGKSFSKDLTLLWTNLAKKIDLD
jgi:hypothetical protein